MSVGFANRLTPLPQHAAWSDKLAEFNRVTSDRDAAREEHEGLRKKRLSEFMAGFLVITNKLKEMYQVRSYHFNLQCACLLALC